PSVEHAVFFEAARQLGGRRAAKRRRERKTEDQRARGLAELTAREDAHVLPVSRAARSTARMMRPWVPQRQRLAARPSRTSCSLGCGMRSSSSFALMIMALMQ